ncbi:MAG TPA: RecQ family ATP-dependent DNA helicase [Gammaproteobacteria bacterium]|nr:RecQ family ATP-dependent DNA helicase [Gammaproteobacteria bacterium]
MNRGRAQPVREQIRSAGEQLLGLNSLRPAQEEALLAVLDGHDTLVVLSTGSGKSAIYQIAGSLIPGPTVVVSPLIALQKDQSERLEDPRTGGAAVINSTSGQRAEHAALAGLERDALEFIFLAPEQLQRPELLARLRAAKPTLFVVDEAHCISEWGHDFRPDYLALGDVIESLGHPPVLALTATASRPVRDEIAARLRMRFPNVVAGDMDRPNIFLSVSRAATQAKKLAALLEAVEHADKPGIVYAATRRHAEEVAAALEARGLRADFYHGGIGNGARVRVQDAFMSGRLDVLAATSAFGMGIDQPNIRFVHHYDVSDSLDAYYQQIGRAGRDGEAAEARLFWRPEDLSLYKFFAGGGKLKAEDIETVVDVLEERGELAGSELAEETRLSRFKLAKATAELIDQGAVEKDAEGVLSSTGNVETGQAADAAVEHERRRHERQLRALDRMRIYAEMLDCRRQYLLEYFGEPAEPCGRCDNCRRGALEAAPQEPFPVSARVVHRKLGKGLVLAHDGGRMTVLFDDAGEKVFDTKYAASRNLIERVHQA